MRFDDNKLKTLGPQSAKLIVGLYDRGREIFGIKDVHELTGLSEASARSLVRKLVDRGVVTRLKPGLFQLVPFQLGSQREFVGNPYVIARELIQPETYYISHASAMDIHGMMTQPQLVVFVTTLGHHRPMNIHGYEYRFVRTKPEHFFGITQHWIDKHEQVTVSDLEKTIIDGLKQPEHCGGFTEIAKGFWMRRSDMNIDKLADYALKLDVSVVARRLGFMLDVFGIKDPSAIERLQAKSTRPYLLLDPVMPNEGSYQSRWKLRLNVDPDEIRSVVRT